MPPLATVEGGEALKWLFFAYSSVHQVWLRLLLPDQVAGEAARDEAFDRALTQIYGLYEMIDAQLRAQDCDAGDTLPIADM